MSRGVVGPVEPSQVLVDLVEGILADASNGISLVCEGSSVNIGQLRTRLEAERDPPSSLILLGLRIPSGQESILPNADLTRLLGYRDNGESDFPNPGILENRRSERLVVESILGLTYHEGRHVLARGFAQSGPQVIRSRIS